MRTFGSKLGSHRMSMFETLADNPEGLTPPEIVSMAEVPKSTVHRIVKDWKEKGVLVPTGRHRKSTIYQLNPRDEEIRLMVKAVSDYTIRLASAQAAKHEADHWEEPAIATDENTLPERQTAVYTFADPKPTRETYTPA